MKFGHSSSDDWCDLSCDNSCVVALRIWAAEILKLIIKVELGYLIDKKAKVDIATKVKLKRLNDRGRVSIGKRVCLAVD